MTDRWQAGVDAIVENRKHYTPERLAEYARVQAEALEFLEPYGNVLDVGCGDGGMRLALGEKVASYYGVDPTIAMQTIVASRTRTEAVWREKAESLPALWTSCFDTVLCYSVLQHVEDPAAALAEMHRVLKPGGLLALLVACAENPPNPIFMHQFQPADVLALVEAASFAVEGFKVIDGRHLCVRGKK